MRNFTGLVALAAAFLIPSEASAQIGVPQTIGSWTLLQLGDSCVLSTEMQGQRLELNGLRTGGGVTLTSPAIAKLAAGTVTTVALNLGTAGVASLKGTVTPISGQNMLLIGLKADVLLTHLRTLSRFTASIGGAPVFEVALPGGSSAAYEAFAACSASL